MKKSILFLAVFVLTIVNVKAQCPTAIANFPDSACTGSSIQYSNTSTGNNLTTEWDFNISDTKTIPAGNFILNNVPGLGSGLGIDFATENGNYYAFSINLSGNLTRYDFGNSINNNPTTTSLGNLGVLPNCVDIRILFDNGNWYGLTNTFSNQIIRINFGNSLINTPTATILNLPPSLFNTPYYMSAEKIGANFYAIVSNYSGANITVVEFGNSLSNDNPNGYTITVPFANPISAVLTIDCDEIYAIVGFASSDPLVQIDFGTTMSATPISFNPLTATTGTAVRRIDLFNDGDNYILMGHSFGGETMYSFNFGRHINNLSPSITNLGNMGILSSGFYNNSINKKTHKILSGCPRLCSLDIKIFHVDIFA